MKILSTAVVAGVVALSVMFTGPQLTTTSTAAAADFKPAVIYDMGGKFDKSFNEGVWNGVEKFTKETGVEVMEFEVTNETQREQAMRRMAERGATIVLGVGFAQADASQKLQLIIRISSSLSLMWVGWMHRTCANMCLKNMKEAI